MPRITGATIKEHVAKQEAAVIAAATRLFGERGFEQVTMTDIAEEVHLARTSLYRYFPDKDHILLAWLRREINGLIDRSDAIARSDAAAADRLRRWLDLQLDYVADPEHKLFSDIASGVGNLAPAVRAEIGERHRELYATVEVIVADMLREAGRRHDAHLVAGFVLGLFRAAAGALGRGMDTDRVRRELQRAAAAVVDAP